MSKLISGQKLKLRVAHASRELHPSEDLSELPLAGQEYQRWCCHRKTDRPRSAFWTVGPATHLICRFHADSSAQMDLRAPSNVAAHSLSLQGTPTDVFQFLDIHFEKFSSRYFRVLRNTPHYLSSFRSTHSRN